MVRELVVIGAGGFGRETLDVIEAHAAAHWEEAFRVLGVADDAPHPSNLARLRARGHDVIGSVGELIERYDPVSYLVGIGDPVVRRRVATVLDAAGWRAASIVHPRAVVGSVVTLSAGTVVCAGVQLSTNCHLGRHVHLNPGAIIGHDAVLQDFVSVNPGAIVSGEVTVEDGVLLGAGSAVLQGLRVGASSVVGAMACVTRDVPSGAVVKGVPARVG